MSEKSSFFWVRFLLQTDILSLHKSSAIDSPSEQQRPRKQFPAYDEKNASPSRVAATKEALACNFMHFSLLQMFVPFLGSKMFAYPKQVFFMLKVLKLISCKHFSQQKALFEEGLITSGWMTIFCLGFPQKIWTQHIFSVMWYFSLY